MRIRKLFRTKLATLKRESKSDLIRGLSEMGKATRLSEFGCRLKATCRYFDDDGVVCNEEGNEPLYCPEYHKLTEEESLKPIMGKMEEASYLLIPPDSVVVTH